MVKLRRHILRDQISLWVFPEGTRSSKPDPTLLPFKRGAFHLAVQAQVPIVPVVCENYHRLFDGMTRMDRGTLTLRGMSLYALSQQPPGHHRISRPPGASRTPMSTGPGQSGSAHEKGEQREVAGRCLGRIET